MNILEQFKTFVVMWEMFDTLNQACPFFDFYMQQFVTLRNRTIEVTNLYNDIILALGQKDYATFLTLVQELEHKTQENPLEQ